MAFLDALLNGLTLGGMYALVAMGLTLQYGVARIMNLSYGEFLIAAAFAAFWLFQVQAINPLLALVLVVPVAFGANWLIYQIMLHPLVKRSRDRGELEVNSILATFGLLFVIQGLVLLLFGSNYFSYTYISNVFIIAGSPIAADRLLAVAVAVVLGTALYLLLMRTRPGTALRAVSVDPRAAQLAGIDVRAASAMAFALGGGLVAASGVLVSMFTTFNASMGVVFTMKALIVVIMGGAGHLMGALAAGLILGLVESFVAVYVAPGLTLAATFALFLIVLLIRPTGMMGRAGA